MKPRCFGSNPSYQAQAEFACEDCPTSSECFKASQDHNHIVKNLYRAYYSLSDAKKESTRLFIASSLSLVLDHIVSYDINKLTVELVESDISLTILGK